MPVSGTLSIEPDSPERIECLLDDFNDGGIAVHAPAYGYCPVGDVRAGMKPRVKLCHLRSFNFAEVKSTEFRDDVTAKAKPVQLHSRRFQVTVDVCIVNLDKVARFHSILLSELFSKTSLLKRPER